MSIRAFVANMMSMRRAMMEENSTFGGKRDIDKECGYPSPGTLTPRDYRILYDREAVANRVVSLMPKECWKVNPSVYETDNPETTEFENKLDEIVEKYDLWSFLEKADILSGIGRYGVILMGISDGKPLNEAVPGVTESKNDPLPEEITNNFKLLYLRVYDEELASVAAIDSDVTSERYGKPTSYNIKMTSYTEGQLNTNVDHKVVNVHWTRVIHIADNKETSEVVGVPRLQPVYNRIYDLRKVIGGSGEMFWKGGYPGLSFEVQPGLENVEFDEEAFKAEVEDYSQGLNRYLRLIGIKANSLAPEVEDPTPHVNIHLDQVCIAIECPKRIFLGTESAHLASTQDQKTWSDRVNGRRRNHVRPYIVYPVIRRLMMYGILPPVDEFVAEWNDPTEVDPLIRAQVFDKLVNAMAQYISTGLAGLVPPLEFFTVFLDIPTDKAQLIINAAEEQARTAPEDRLPLTWLDAVEQAKEALEGDDGTLSGPNGPKAGTGARRESKDVSTNQNG